MTQDTQGQAKRKRQGTDGIQELADYGFSEGMIQYQIRIQPQMKKQLEAEAERLTTRYGVPVSTSAVLRKFISEGLQRAKGQR